jgi:iron-sulfur cluster assembly protein
MTTTLSTKPRRPLPKAVKLSDAAAARIREIMTNAEGKYQGVRVGVENGGCAGMSYTMDYAETAQPFEEVVEDKGVKVFIDPKAIMFLIGTEMDFFRRNSARASCSTIRTRRPPAAAARACRSRRRSWIEKSPPPCGEADKIRSAAKNFSGGG